MKILIVEDEPLTRENIILILKAHGYSSIIEASNGKEALESLKKNSPQLIITDIRMPQMDGLKFIEEAKKLFPNILYIIISSYDMFEYAQKAISLGVYSYLLKPIKEDELLQCVSSCLDIIHTSTSPLDMAADTVFPSKEYYEITKRKFINDLVYHHLTDESYIKSFSEEYGLCKAGNIFAVSEILIDNYSLVVKAYSQEDKNILNYGLENVALEILSTLNITTFPFDYPSGCGILLNFNNIDMLSIEIQKAFIKIKESIASFTDFTVTVCIGKPVNAPKDIYYSEKTASELSLSRLVSGGNHLYTSQIEDNKSLPTAHFENNLKLALNSGNFDMALNVIYDIYHMALKEGYSCTLLSKLHLNIIIILFTTLENMSLPMTAVFGNEITVYNNLRCMINIENVFQYYCTIINYVKNQWKRENQTQNQILITRAKDYIFRNYMQDISLHEMAGFCNLSPSYFSKIFKEYCQKNFTTYLTEFRIQKALDLLNTTPMHINEIAKAVGFQDDKYFHRSFKKIVGVSPGKYRTSSFY